MYVEFSVRDYEAKMYCDNNVIKSRKERAGWFGIPFFEGTTFGRSFYLCTIQVMYVGHILLAWLVQWRSLMTTLIGIG